MIDKYIEEYYRYVHFSGTECLKGNTLEEVSFNSQDKEECFAVISPHDDDGALGAGLLMQLALEEGVKVHVVIVTDGGMGYCSNEEKGVISGIRKEETHKCYKTLGIPEENIHWLGFPDCNLFQHQGRRKCQTGEMGEYAGYTGLQNSFTQILRKVRPTQCFIPTRNDLHPDHKLIYDELLISIFHATGSIWPELGLSLEQTPSVHEIAVYCDFPEPPTFQINADESLLERKLYAINAFQSQKQIASLIEGVRNGGPQEYLRTIDFRFYNPKVYSKMFQKILKEYEALAK